MPSLDLPNRKGGIHDRIEAWKAGNVMCSEMESAALFVISSIRNVRAGGIMAFSDIEDQASAVDKAIRTACEGIKLLIERDKS